MSNISNPKILRRICVVIAGGVLLVPSISFASGLTSAQIQSILSILSSFGADSATVANVQSVLTGSPVSSGASSTASVSSSSTCNFTKNLTLKSSGSDVTCLQQALKTEGYMSTAATGYFGALTRVAVTAWQKANNIPATGKFDSTSRAHWSLDTVPSINPSNNNTVATTATTSSSYANSCNGTQYPACMNGYHFACPTNNGSGYCIADITTSTPVISSGGLTVALSATSPSGSSITQGQGIADLADFTFSNPTSASVNITSLLFNRIGVSSDSALQNVYLYNNSTRITDSQGVSNGQISFNNTSGLFTVPANGTYTVSVRSDIANNTSGQQVGVSLVAVGPSSALDPSISLPINSGYQVISAPQSASVSFSAAVTPSTSANLTITPQKDYAVWQDTVSVSTHTANLTSIKFTNLGSIDSSNVTSLRLYVDGVQAGTTVASIASDRTVTFDLSSAPILLSTQSHVIKVLADITGGSSRTIIFSVQRSSDAAFVDNQINQPVIPVSNGGATFSAIYAGTITISSVSTPGSVSVSLDPSSPSQSVVTGSTDVKWATFDLVNSGGEDMRIGGLTLSVVGNAAGASGLQNGKMFVNGLQVDKTNNICEGPGLDTGLDCVNGFNLDPINSQNGPLILKVGQTAKIDIYANAKDTSGANLPSGASITVNLIPYALSLAQGMSSLYSVPIPSSTVSGNAIPIVAQ